MNLFHFTWSRTCTEFWSLVQPSLMYSYIYTPQKTLLTTCTIFTFFQKFWKLLEKLIIVIDKTHLWRLLIEIGIKLSSFYFSFSYKRESESKGVNSPILQKSKRLKFYLPSQEGYMEVICCNFLKFLAIFMKSHTMKIKTLWKKNIIMVMWFWGDKSDFWIKNSFISQNKQSFT